MMLNNGGVIPQIQFGTYKMKGDECYKGVLSALRSVILYWSCTELTAQGMVNHPHQG